GFLFLNCACGLKMKVPPEYQKPAVTCPRCGTVNQIPTAELAAAAAVLEAQRAGAAPAPPGQVYRRRGGGWESFRCGCGRTLQISPAFVGDQVTCSNCGRVTTIEESRSA